MGFIAPPSFVPNPILIDNTASTTFLETGNYEDVILDSFSNLLLKRSNPPTFPSLVCLSAVWNSVSQPDFVRQIGDTIRSNTLPGMWPYNVLLWPYCKIYSRDEKAVKGHWVLFAVFVRRHPVEAKYFARIQLINPLQPEVVDKEYEEKIRWLVALLHEVVGPSISVEISTGPIKRPDEGAPFVPAFYNWPIQKDANNCGPYVAAAMEAISAGIDEADYRSDQTRLIRLNVARYLAEFAENPKRVPEDLILSRKRIKVELAGGYSVSREVYSLLSGGVLLNW